MASWHIVSCAISQQLSFLVICAVMLGPLVDIQWGIYVQCGSDSCSGAYASNVTCMYTSTPGHTVHIY